MKRVVHLSSVHSANDTRIFLKECRSLAAAGYNVTLIARADSDCEKHGVKIVSARRFPGGRFGRMPLTTLDVLRKALRCGADIYHFHDPELIPVGVALRLTGAKVVYDVHEDLPRQILSKRWVPSLLRQPLAYATEGLEWLTARFFFNFVLAATPKIGRRFPDGKTVVVQNFPIVGELASPGPIISMEERPLNVVYVGGLTSIRGVLEMVSAMEAVETPGCRLTLTGQFMEEDLERTARALKGWQHVDYLGWLDRPAVAQVLGTARAGLVVLQDVPNYTDSYPVKLFECMSVGLPIIASSFSLWRSIIEGERCGLLVNPRDVTAIAKAIDWILSHPEEATAMGRRGRQAVQERYNWADQESKLLTVYSSLFEKPTRRKFENYVNSGNTL